MMFLNLNEDKDSKGDIKNEHKVGVKIKPKKF